MHFRICLAFLVLLPLESAARMYQWVDSQTGNVQMSGKPPGWYRSSDKRGPRVLVFENGKLVDDTARSLSQAENTTLRDRALEAAAQASDVQSDQQAADAQDGGHGSSLFRSLLGNGANASDPGGADPSLQAAPEDDAAAVERLKAIIADWERRQYEEKQKLVNDPGVPTAEPFYGQ